MAAKKQLRPPTTLRAPGLAPVISLPRLRDYVIVELRHDSQVAYTTTGFRAPAVAEKAARSLNDTLEGFRVRRVRTHLECSSSDIRKRSTQAPPSLGRPVTAEFAHAGFVQVEPRSAKDCARLAERLSRLPSVWKAIVAPHPVPAAVPEGRAPGSRNFEPAQGYLHSAPNGIGAMAVWNLRGGRGEGVTVCDIEGNWNRRHEDLPAVQVLGGTMIPDLGWRNHGTAVLGEIVSSPGTRGCVGIAHRARAAVHAAKINNVWNTAGAITRAARRLRAGDVILIELQGTGPRGRYVAMQYWDDVFSAIRFATARGITVVEAAGNGGEDFQHTAYRGSGLQKDAGAIVVGAGVPPTNWFDWDDGNRYKFIGVPRSRIWFSNYGRIVSVQAWGWHVTTLAYGDAQGGAESRWYTLRFSGTSSASPIVTGAVACIQGRAKVRRGHPLTPAQVRSLLIRTGTPQVAGGPNAPVSQHIGPQPNLERAFPRI